MSEMRVPDGWEVSPFSLLAKVENGYAFKSSDFVESDGDSVPIVRMSDIKSGKLDFSTSKYVSKTIVDGLGRYRLHDGDFVFGMSGSLSNYAWVSDVDGECYQNQRVGRLKSVGSDKRFVSYTFLSKRFQEEILSLAAGAAQLNVSGKQIEGIQVLHPPLPEQQKIASILTSVDEVIEKTQSQINKLQDLKKGTMNELLTRGIGHTEFKDSPVGRIPKGWEVTEFGNVTSLIKSGLSRRISMQDIGLPVINSGNIQNNSLVTDELKYWYREDPQGVDTGNYFLDDGDILLNFINSISQIGKSCIYSDIGRDAIYTTNVFRVKVMSAMDSYFIHQVMLSEKFQSEIQLITKPAVNQASFTKQDLVNIKVAVPQIEEQKKIASILSSIDKNIEEKQRKLTQIQSLKKSLMQDLLTGKKRVMV